MASGRPKTKTRRRKTPALGKGLRAKLRKATRQASRGLQKALARVNRRVPGWRIGVAAFALYGLSLLEPYSQLGVVVCEFCAPIAAAMAAAALLLATRRAWVAAVLCVAAAALTLQPEWPFLRWARPTPGLGPSLSVAQLHDVGHKGASPALGNLITQEKIDVLSLTGTGATTLRQLPGMHEVALEVGGTLVPQTLFVRDSLWSAPKAVESSVSLRVGRCDVRLHAMQLPSALSAADRSARARAIDALIDQPRARLSVWVGHLASKSTRSDLSELRKRHELRDVRRGQGRLATSPFWLGPLGLLHDDILVHGFISVTRARTLSIPGDAPGRVLVADLALTEPRCAEKPALGARF